MTICFTSPKETSMLILFLCNTEHFNLS
jgi:hypothetical protein